MTRIREEIGLGELVDRAVDAQGFGKGRRRGRFRSPHRSALVGQRVYIALTFRSLAAGKSESVFDGDWLSHSSPKEYIATNICQQSSFKAEREGERRVLCSWRDRA
jgi:hypothetical protein